MLVRGSEPLFARKPSLASQLRLDHASSDVEEARSGEGYTENSCIWCLGLDCLLLRCCTSPRHILSVQVYIESAQRPFFRRRLSEKFPGRMQGRLFITVLFQPSPFCGPNGQQMT